jgi:serine/threonine-protein kinase RsbW
MTQASQLTINATMDEIEHACVFVSVQAREAGMDEESVYRCYLSVEEACTNIIEHGYHCEGHEKQIEVRCRHTRHWFTIIIMDDARPFNPLSRADPDPSAPLMQRSGGGWGIYFVKKFMDRVEYCYRDNRNHLIISKRLR